MSRYELADTPKKRKTMSTKNIKNIKVIATILLSTFAAICYPQKVLNQVYSSKPIQVDGTTNCPGIQYCIHHSACEFSPYFLISYNKETNRLYLDVFISDKKLDYDYMIRMPHTLTLTCKKGPKIISEGKVHFKKEPTYRTGYSTEFNKDFSVIVNTPDGAKTFFYNVKYNDPSRFHPELIISEPGEILMRFPITKEDYGRIMKGIKKINISNFKDYKFYKDYGDYEIKTKSTFGDLILQQFSNFTKVYNFCQ